MIDDALRENPGRTRADLVESLGGWAAMRADAVVALINGTVRSESVPATDVEVIVEADPVHSCASGMPPRDRANAFADAAGPREDGVNFVVDGRAVAPTEGKDCVVTPALLRWSRILGARCSDLAARHDW